MSSFFYSKTAQRAYLLIALAIFIFLIIRFWPAPQQPSETFVEQNDTTSTNDRHRPSQRPHHRKTAQHRNLYPKYDTTQRTARTTPHYDSASLSKFAPRKRENLMVEINSADTLTLQLLNGIGSSYSRRIVNYRNRLGGFTDIRQLMEVYGMTKDLFEKIATHITIDTTHIQQIKINQTTIKQISRHPYISYQQARDLIAWRDRGHKYKSSDDLRMVVTMDDITVEKFAPYVSFEE